MTSIRDRFQAAKLEANRKVTEEVEKTFKSNSTRGDYHTIDEGKNYFRMMPPHNPDEPSMQAKVIYWLDCKIEEMKDDKPTGKTLIKSRPIFDSRIHGGTPKDIIDEYINFTKKSIYEAVQDKEEKSKLLAPINGWRDKNGKWNPGILPSQSFVCYATKGEIIPENLGRLELWKKDKETLEKLNISEESDEPIVTDSFSDPDEGVQFIITKGRDEKNNLFTLIQKNTFNARGSKNISGAYEQWASSQVVSDEVLEKLLEMEPLSKQFKNVYKDTDFNRALEALEMFDEKNGYGTFENVEFQKIIEEVAKYYINSNSNEREKPTTKEESVVKTVKQKIEKSLTIDEMDREQLKKYIKEKGYSIRVLSSMSEDMIRDFIVDYETEDTEEPKNLPEVDFSEEKSDIQPDTSFDKEEKEEVFEKKEVIESLKERLARLKKQS